MGKSWSFRQSFAFFLIFIPALLFYAMQKKSLENPPWAVLQPPAHWVQESYDVFTNQLQATLVTYLDLINIKQKNSDLLRENGELNTQLQLLEEYRTENSRLRALLSFKQELKRKSVSARIISKDILIDQKSVLIDKGTEDGLERLQAVLSPQGVVGYVISVEKKSSRVLLLTDRSASVDTIVQRTRARGITSGRSQKNCTMKYIVRKEDVAEGDVVVTSGRQGFFPKGFIVGHILSVEESPTGVSYNAVIQPAAPIDRLEEVLVIVNKQPALASKE